MTKTAWVFPGQGSQTVGMCRDLYDNVPAAKTIFDAADEALGFSLSGLIFNGPDEDLRQTINAQPALVTASIACLEAAKNLAGDKLSPPSYLAGHSLGEYTALAVSGVFDFATAVKLARERGRLMHEAGQKTPGAMAAVLGLDADKLDGICEETGVVMANVNSPGQIVISGAAAAVAKASGLAVAAGAKRAVPLQVSGAFHSPLMQPAVEGMVKYLDAASYGQPAIPVIANCTGSPMTSTDAVKKELRDQLTSPVQWQRSVEYMVSQGVTTFIEIGPGKVLTGLISRIVKDAAVINLNSLDGINAFGQ